jgi:hypothetical protein
MAPPTKSVPEKSIAGPVMGKVTNPEKQQRAELETDILMTDDRFC